MKTNLLFGAALIASLAVSAPSTNAKSAMDHNLKCLWMNTDVAPLHTSARQGVAVNGKFYLQNKDTQKIEIWDQTGKVGELDSGKGTNITRDDAGNIIVRTGEFNTNYNVNKGVRIISPTGETKDFEIAGIPAGRADFWGHVSGNVLSDEGGILYMGTQWQPNMIEVPIKNGAQDAANTYSYNFVPNEALKVGGTFTTTHLISNYGFDTESVSMLSPEVKLTNTTSATETLSIVSLSTTKATGCLLVSTQLLTTMAAPVLRFSSSMERNTLSILPVQTMPTVSLLQNFR